nr:hypothetical protein [Tanacetum cinerariifolium]
SWVRMDGSVRGVSGLQESGLWKWGDLAGKREEMNSMFKRGGQGWKFRSCPCSVPKVYIVLPPEVVLSHICIFNSCDVS